MPHEFLNKIVVTKEELVPVFYKTEQYLSERLSIEEKRGYGMRKVQSGGNGRKLLIEYDSLSKEIKEQIPDPRRKQHILENFFKIESETVDFYTDYTFPDGKHIEKTSQDLCIANYSLLQACAKLKIARENEIKSKAGSLVGIMKTIYSDAMSFTPVLNSIYGVQHNLPQNYIRFMHKYKKFESQNYISVIKKHHGNSNTLKVTKPLESFFNNLFSTQNHKPNHYEIYKQYQGFLDGYVTIINNVTGEFYNPKESYFKQVSASTIYNFLTKWNNEIGNLNKRSGDRQKYMQKFKTYHSLDLPKYAGSIISVDDRQPPFEYIKGSRMWFYNGIDLASGCFTAWVYGKTKEGIILDFYRQMVRNYAEWGFNLPAEIECESSLNSTFKDTILKQGNMFEYVRIEANNARGKKIEQFYRPLRYGLEKKQEGWLARPFAIDESNQAGNTPVPIIPYDTLTEQCLQNLETWNNMPSLQDSTKTRWEYFCENQNPNIKPTKYKAILPHIGYKTKTSCHVGIIKLQQKEFLIGDNGKIFTGEKLINIMTQIEGETIEIYWLDSNDGNVLKALVYFDNRYICEAIEKPRYVRAKIEQTQKDLDAYELMSKYASTINGYGNSRTEELEKLTVIDKTPVILNNNFKMPGLKQRYEASENDAEILPESKEFEYELISNESSIKTSLKDRF